MSRVSGGVAAVVAVEVTAAGLALGSADAAPRFEKPRISKAKVEKPVGHTVQADGNPVKLGPNGVRGPAEGHDASVPKPKVCSSVNAVTDHIPDPIKKAVTITVDVVAGDAIDCFANPSVFQCGIAVATMVPVGKAGKVLYRIADNGYDAAKAASRSRRAKNSRPCLLNSFTGATPVLMADGTTKPIKSIELGDKVAATDPETGETGPRRVVDLIQHGGIHIMVAIRLADGSTIRATDEHPFWDADSATWINAIDLRPGDQLTTADGELIHITDVDIRQQSVIAYNLTVTDLHTYHAGSSSVLVHNDGESPVGTIFRDGKYSFQIYSNDHGPAHGHLRGPGIAGGGIQLGQNGKPLDPNVNLSSAQRDVVDRNRSTIRKSISKYMRWYNRNGSC